jgi:hypothetical protein
MAAVSRHDHRATRLYGPGRRQFRIRGQVKDDSLLAVNQEAACFTCGCGGPQSPNPAPTREALATPTTEAQPGALAHKTSALRRHENAKQAATARWRTAQ